MKKPLFVSLFVAILLVLAPNMLLGQTGPAIAHDDAQRHLDRTDLIIEHAKEVVRSSNSPVVQFNLQNSIDTQEKARECFRNSSIKMAKTWTLQARDYAQDAINAGRQVEHNKNVVQSKLEQLNEMLERVRDMAMLSTSTNINFEATYMSAQDNLQRAREFCDVGQYRAALMLTNQVEKALQGIIQAHNSQSRNQANYELRTRAVRELIDRAMEDLTDCGSGNASKLLIQARETYAVACELGSQSKFQAALKVLQNAKKITDEAIGMCRGQQRLQVRYDRLWSEAARLKESVSLSDDRAMKLLELSYEQLKLADNWLRADKNEAATAALKASELALGQLKRYIRNKGF